MVNERKMPKGYIILWSVMTAAYAVRMFFMKNTVLGTFGTLEAKTVNLFKDKPPVVFDDITGMIGRHWLYPIWIAYIDLFLLNFTDIYSDDKLVEKKKNK